MRTRKTRRIRRTHTARKSSAPETIRVGGRLYTKVEDPKTRTATFSDVPSTEMSNLAGKVAKELDWNIYAAYDFCVALLTDVNAHRESKEVYNLFVRMYNEEM